MFVMAFGLRDDPSPRYRWHALAASKAIRYGCRKAFMRRSEYLSFPARYRDTVSIEIV